MESEKAYTHIHINGIAFLQFSPQKVKILLPNRCFASLHGWLISPIWQYFSFWFIIAHATSEVLSICWPQWKPRRKKRAHNNNKNDRRRINSNTHGVLFWHNTGRRWVSVDCVWIWIIRLQSVYVYLFTATTITTNATNHRHRHRHFYPFVITHPTEYEIFENEPL